MWRLNLYTRGHVTVFGDLFSRYLLVERDAAVIQWVEARHTICQISCNEEDTLHNKKSSNDAFVFWSVQIKLNLFTVRLLVLYTFRSKTMLPFSSGTSVESSPHSHHALSKCLPTSFCIYNSLGFCFLSI